MANLQAIAFRLAIIIIMINVLMFTGGYISVSEVPTVSRVLSGVTISDYNSSGFQENLVLKDDNSTSILDNRGGSYGVSILDFLEQIPFIGPIIFIFRLLYEILATASFGFVAVLIRMNMPGQIVIPLGLLAFVVYAIAIYEHIIDFIARRGGTK